MRNLLFVILAAALAWSGYWLWGARAVERDAEAWLEARAAEGWQAEASDVSLRGFPNRHDLTLRDVALADPDTGLGWQAPFFQLLRLSYRPGHVIAVWPDSQRVFWPDGGVTLDSDAMRASVVLDGDTLDRATLVADVLNLRSDTGRAAAFARVQLDARRTSGEDGLYQLALMADGFAPRLPNAIRGLPATFDTLRGTANVRFDRPWTLEALREDRPQPAHIDLTLAEVSWGALGLRATGQVQIDASGVAQGSLAVQVRNWREAVALMRQSGEVAPGIVSSVEQFLTVMARLKGNAATLDLTLDLTAGRVFAGPLPLGTLPPLTLP